MYRWREGSTSSLLKTSTPLSTSSTDYNEMRVSQSERKRGNIVILVNFMFTFRKEENFISSFSLLQFSIGSLISEKHEEWKKKTTNNNNNNNKVNNSDYHKYNWGERGMKEWMWTRSPKYLSKTKNPNYIVSYYNF